MNATANEPEIVVGSCEQLLHLLAEPAEVEHTLMCSYLYAAFSLKRCRKRGVSEEQSESVRCGIVVCSAYKQSSSGSSV
ncbi:hypothetical protein U1737_07430 [Sphingomonas sp. LB3N6]|uniref:hypothetical protein n=1 Tax=Sphingomonas fucosidasi TaxID=3096164 RepID=UPI002FCC4AE4